jgi:DNA-binding MarR family transcriptional regulator
LIDKLEAKRLVVRKRGQGDRRQVLCGVTPEGLDIVAAITPGVDARVDAALAALTAEEGSILIQLLDKLRERLNQPL